MTQQHISAEEARVGMHGRILRCPLGDNPEDCPLYEIRKWPMEKRLDWLNSRTDEEIIALYSRHNDCLEHKLTPPSSS
ncbi:MAG: hypothetical protein ABFS03_11395 [Chloroflexota bacterium]